LQSARRVITHLSYHCGDRPRSRVPLADAATCAGLPAGVVTRKPDARCNGFGTNDGSERSGRTQLERACTPYPSQGGTKPPPAVYRHWLGLLLALGLTAGAFYFAVRGIDTATLWRRVANQNHSLMIVAALLLVVQILFGAERWRAILKMLVPDRSVPLIGVHAGVSTAAFFNWLSPGHL